MWVVDIERMQVKVDAMKVKIDEQDADIDTLQSDAKALKKRVVKLENFNRALLVRLDGMDTATSDSNSAISDLDTRVTDNETAIADNATGIGNVTNIGNSQASTITTLQSDLDTLTTRVDSLP